MNVAIEIQGTKDVIIPAMRGIKLPSFRNGEGFVYSQALESASEVLERSNLPDDLPYEFNCSDSVAKLSVVKGDKKVELFSIWFDTFTPGRCGGTCSGYVQQEIFTPMHRTLETLKQLFG